MSKKPYDWDRPKGEDLLDVSDLGIDIDYRAQWHAPINTVERAFWRGAVIGAIAEAVAFLLIFGIIWLL